MVSSIRRILPPQHPDPPQPALPRPDDRTRVLDRQHVFADEPEMQALFASLDERNRRFLLDAADRERARLPLFPAFLAD
jgi:hypothetical protein